MTNNQTWPDSAYLERGNYWSPIKRDDSVEYYSADKVREIQLATIRKTLEVLTAAGLREFDIYPESIIEQVKI